MAKLTEATVKESYEYNTVSLTIEFDQETTEQKFKAIKELRRKARELVKDQLNDKMQF